MTYTGLQFRKLSILFYLLSILLAFNLYFNLHYDWFGISLIVRVYLYVFSFYLIYTYNIQGLEIVETLTPYYNEKYGRKGGVLLEFERRFFPFVIIVAVIFIFTLIDYCRSDDWPWEPLLKFLGGRYSNLLLYSVIFNFILNIRRRPMFAVPVFIIISLVFFAGDYFLGDLYSMGIAISLFKILKLILFFTIFLYDYTGGIRSLVLTMGKAVLCGAALYMLILGTYVFGFSFSKNIYFVHRETGLSLARLGFSYPLAELQKRMVENRDVKLLPALFSYGKYYGILPEYSDEIWLSVLFAQQSEQANDVARFMLSAGKTAPFDLIMSYANDRSSKNDPGLIGADAFNKLAARSVAGKENEFMKKIERSGKTFAIWGIRVLGETGDPQFVPFLMKYLGDIDETLSREAYISLRNITHIDPAQERKIAINDPEVFYEFKKAYLEKRTPR
jgi:hypothetical protein